MPHYCQNTQTVTRYPRFLAPLEPSSKDSPQTPQVKHQPRYRKCEKEVSWLLSHTFQLYILKPAKTGSSTFERTRSIYKPEENNVFPFTGGLQQQISAGIYPSRDSTQSSNPSTRTQPLLGNNTVHRALRNVRAESRARKSPESHFQFSSHLPKDKDNVACSGILGIGDELRIWR